MIKNNNKFGKNIGGGNIFKSNNILFTFIFSALRAAFLFGAAIAILAVLPAVGLNSGGAAPAVENISFSVLGQQGLEPPAVFSKPPENIAVLYPQSLSLIYLFGVQKKAAAMPLLKLKISLHDGGFYSQADPEILTKIDIGYPAKPDIEAITGINPGLLISPTFQIKADKFFAKLKIPIFRVHGTFSDYKQWLEAVEKFGALFDQKSKAADYCDYFNKTIALTVFNGAAGAEDNKPGGGAKNAARKKAAHITLSGNNYIIAGEKSKFIKWFLKNAGCEVLDYPENTAGEIPLSIEDFVKFDPEYIFIDKTTHAGGFQNAGMGEEFWKKTKAYKENKIYFVPSDDRTCFLTNQFFVLCAPLGMLWTAKILYPEKFESLDLEKERRDFYSKFLNIDYDLMIKADKLLTPKTQLDCNK
jgi:ABC-type Fe3+-hydroxamate transport system substrate-binding protein